MLTIKPNDSRWGIGNGDAAINKVRKMQKTALEISRGFNPPPAAPVEHNNFSRDFKTVNFLPRNHRSGFYSLSLSLSSFLLPNSLPARFAHGVYGFVFAPAKTQRRRAVSSGRTRTRSRDRLSFHTDYNEATGERDEESPCREQPCPMFGKKRGKGRAVFI